MPGLQMGKPIVDGIISLFSLQTIGFSIYLITVEDTFYQYKLPNIVCIYDNMGITMSERHARYSRWVALDTINALPSTV